MTQKIFFFSWDGYIWVYFNAGGLAFSFETWLFELASHKNYLLPSNSWENPKNGYKMRDENKHTTISKKGAENVLIFIFCLAKTREYFTPTPKASAESVSQWTKTATWKEVLVRENEERFELVVWID